MEKDWEAYLENIIKKREPKLTESKLKIQNALKKSKCLIYKFNNKCIPKIELAGSFKKGTAIDSSDVDIAYKISPECELNAIQINESLYANAKKCAPNSEIHQKNVSVEIDGDDHFSIKMSHTNPENGILWDRKNNKRKLTSISGQYKDVDACDCPYLLKLIKIWKEKKVPQISSFIIERAAIYAISTRPRKELLSENFRDVLCYFGDDLNRGDIIDPTNLSNNISSKRYLPKQDYKQLKNTSKIDCKLAQENKWNKVFQLE